MMPLLQIAFVCLIYPVLISCYAGQSAYMSKNLHVEDFNNLTESVPRKLFTLLSFFTVVSLSANCISDAREHFASPGSIRHFFSVLSLFASVVGSQATITASFSIINQCLALNCFPRAKVIHTSDKIHGQVYIPDVNWLLMILSLTVTIGFHDIVRIGNATGTRS